MGILIVTSHMIAASGTEPAHYLDALCTQEVGLHNIPWNCSPILTTPRALQLFKILNLLSLNACLHVCYCAATSDCSFSSVATSTCLLGVSRYISDNMYRCPQAIVACMTITTCFSFSAMASVRAVSVRSDGKVQARSSLAHTLCSSLVSPLARHSTVLALSVRQQHLNA